MDRSVVSPVQPCMPKLPLIALCALSLAACTGVGRASEAIPAIYASDPADDGAPSYPLDAIPRWLSAGSKPSCSAAAAQLVTYRGARLRYDRPVRVHPAFRDHLRDFEDLVVEVAREHFGRVPHQIVHMGAFACRPVRGRPELVSEHALGNALDVAGFDFGPMARKDLRTSTLPRGLKRPFQVRVEKHWKASGDDVAKSAFLHALTDRVIERPDLFRVVLGPGYPGHKNHFHLDQAPYRLIGLE